MSTKQKVRIIRAMSALKAWQGSEPHDEADLRDVITDLLHLAVAWGEDPEAAVRMAVANFEAEQAETLK